MTENEIVEIIESIKYIDDGVYPEEKLETLSEHKELSEKYMIQALKDIVENSNEYLDDTSFLPLYAIAFLAEIRSKKSFEVIVSLMKLESKKLDYILGDALTGIISRVIYYTFNGEEKILLQMIYNVDIDEFVRIAVLKALIYYYVHDISDVDKAKSLLEEIMLTPETYENELIVGTVMYVIIGYSFVDKLSIVEDAYTRGLVDVFSYGKYDSFVDALFSYNRSYHYKPIKLSTEFKNWACFADENRKNSEFDLFDAIEKMKKPKTFVKQESIGRNDPCPCGSGKKYKKCCINKFTADEVFIKDEMVLWLKRYPKVDGERKDGQVLISDLFDDEAIEIDKYLYLALHHRAIPLWEKRDRDEEERRKSIYLKKARKMIDEKMEKEGLDDYAEYDRKHKIHYNVSEIYREE